MSSKFTFLPPRERLEPVWHMGRPAIPLRTLVLSFSVLLVPVIVTVLARGQPADTGLLLWLIALVPAFTLAYYRGWQGVTTALAAGMALLVLVHLGLIVSGQAIGNPPLLLAVIVAYVAIALAVGFLSEMLHAERMRAERLALTDELTGLPNRRYMRLLLGTEFAAAQRGRSLVVVFFDLDQFKQYNDRYGHGAGDEALRIVAGVLAEQTRTMNLSARYGGEEFVSVLSSCEVPGALIYVERIRQKLEAAEFRAGRLTVSAGVAAYDAAMTSADDLLAAADAALYEAKRHAGDHVRVYRPPGAARSGSGRRDAVT